MEINNIVNLMMKSSNNHPHKGMLSSEENILCAIDLAKLCKDFADKGLHDEAMDIPSEDWMKVITELESKLA